MARELWLGIETHCHVWCHMILFSLNNTTNVFFCSSMYSECNWGCTWSRQAIVFWGEVVQDSKIESFGPNPLTNMQVDLFGWFFGMCYTRCSFWLWAWVQRIVSKNKDSFTFLLISWCHLLHDCRWGCNDKWLQRTELKINSKKNTAQDYCERNPTSRPCLLLHNVL